MCPPGLGLASLSAKALAVINREDAPTPFYFSFRRAYTGAEKSESAFTAPVSLIAGLHEALTMIHEEGLPNVLTRHKTLSTALREGGKALGLGIFGNAPVLSSTVVVFSLPETLEGGQIVKALYDRYRTVIAGARNRLAGRVIRIGTMGAITQGTILTDLLHLDAVLASLGHHAPPGAALTAANAILQQGSRP
jgi:aspartate aminotransferase-like enzyme